MKKIIGRRETPRPIAWTCRLHCPFSVAWTVPARYHNGAKSPQRFHPVDAKSRARGNAPSLLKKMSSVGDLLPMAGNPDPPGAPLSPMPFHPHGGDTRTRYPVPRHPRIACACPAPIAFLPNIGWSRRNSLCFHANRRRSLRDNDLACDRRPAYRARRRHLPCDFSCRRRCHGFIGATNQSKWRQCQKINV